VLTYATLKPNRRKFIALTGLTPKEFKFLLPAFERAYRRCYPTTRTRAGTPRQRQRGGGRKSALASPEQKLLFALVYLKAYPLQVVLGELFGLSQSRTNRWIHQLLPILQRALKDLGVRPERNPQQFARHERKQAEPRDLIIDGTERRRQRPKNKAKRDELYSGHKHQHADKNLVIANRKTKRIGFLSQTYPGKVQDKKIADTEQITYPRDTRLGKDTGFQAYEPRGVATYQPKKSRGRVS
jgi:Helix-turn-helix of DDE superfamily endonuclease/DDE superfamily endonuclease